MRLTLQSPTEHRVLDVTWIELTCTSGNLVIMPGHAPLLARLKPQSQIMLGIGTQKQVFTVSGGLVEVAREEVRVLLAV